MRKLILLITLALAGLLCVVEAYAQTVISMTIPANVQQKINYDQWCAAYINIAPATPNSAQEVQCLDILVQRAVQSFGVASSAAQITAPVFNPN